MPSPKARILCTEEDDTDTPDRFKFVLGGEGYEVVITDSAHDALSLPETESFDLSLVDSWMPGLSGDQLAWERRSSIRPHRSSFILAPRRNQMGT
jgi:DNA-binding response OmpR family regulator